MPTLLERVREAVAPAFTVERELGQGGMGIVFLGHDTALDRLVAIKVLRPETPGPQSAQRFLREARLLARVGHANVIPIHQVGESKGLYFYVMEYVPGETVSARLGRGPLSLREILGLGADLLAGLEAVHRLGIVHRDVKPSNIFLLPDRAILTDFGIAQPHGGSDLTGSEEILGTLRYMAPEQLAHSHVDHRADLYAAGLVLCEALMGSLTGVATTYSATIPWSGIPRRFRNVLRRALHPDVSHRWPDAASFRQAFLRRPLVDARSGGVGLGALAAIGLIVWLSGSAPPRRPPTLADLAVLPFDSPDSGRTGSELARFTGDRLQWFPRWTFQPTLRTFGWAATVPVAERQDRAAHELHAGHYVVGRIVSSVGAPLLELTIRDSGGRALNLTPLRVEGSVEDMPAWGRRAADSIATRAFPALAGEFRELGRYGSPDTRAYEEYFKGEEAFQRDAYEEAERDYVAALERDPHFVEASLRLAIVRRFRRIPFEADLKALYERSVADLPEQHRLLIEALLAPDLTERFDRYRAAVRAFARDATVRFVYADELFHRAPLVGIPLDTAIAELGRLIDLHGDLEQAPAYDHLLWGHLRLGRVTDADSSLARRLRIPFSGEAEEARRRRFLQLAYDARFSPWVAGLKLRWLSLTADSVTMETIQRYVRLGNAFDIPGAQLALGRILVRQAKSPAARAGGQRAWGLALMLLGRPREGLAHLDAANDAIGLPDNAVERAEWRVLPVQFGLPLSVSTVSEGKARLEQLALDPLQGPRAAWALAVSSATGGGRAPDAKWGEIVMAAAGRNRAAARLARLLEAMGAAARDHPDSALELSAPLLAYDSAGVVEDPFARAILHLRRADWSLAVGDSAGADRELLWYENSDTGIEGWVQRELQPGEVDATLSGVARLRRARLAIARHDAAAACGWLGRLNQLWSASEPAFETLVAEVRQLNKQCPQ